jgi:acyl carrier protein
MEERVIQILKEIRTDLNDQDFERINSSTNIITEINLSSLQMINFMFRIEEEFNVEIDFDNLDISKMNSITSLCDFIKNCSSLA